MLLVIDDTWRVTDLKPFLHGGPKASRLITTRLDRIVPSPAFRQPVDAMTAHEAFALLSWGLPEADVREQAGALRALAERLGAWAQLLKLVNGVLGFRLHSAREPLERAIAYANRRLDEKGLIAFDVAGDGDRSTAVARTIGVSLDLLDPDQRARFAELAIFPEDTDVPIGIVARLWRETARLDRTDAEDLLGELFGLSLLLDLDLGRETLRLHDTTRHFLVDEARRSNALAVRHQRLALAMGAIRHQKGTPATEAGYFYRFLPHHLAEAGDRPAIDALLLDPAWLKAKLAATGSPQTLVADYEQHGRGQMQSLVGRTLRLTAGICTRDPRQLLLQLFGRLMALPGTATEFAARARAMIVPPVLLPMRPSLTPPGAETMRLEGHTTRVTALAVLPDGRLASGSDYEILLWDPATGAETARLKGHYNQVTGLAVLPDGRLASSSYDKTVRLWDLASGTEIAGLRGHTDWVTALAVLPDGRLASGSGTTVRLWDPATGARGEATVRKYRQRSDPLGVSPPACGLETARLQGHHNWVTALAMLPDGRLVSGSKDFTVRLWDLATGPETARLKGSWAINALAVLPDGRLASSSGDYYAPRPYETAVQLWDLATGTDTGRLSGHTGWVTAFAVLPDGRLASGSEDVRLWDLATGAETARLKGHIGSLTALAALPGGRLVSGGTDWTMHVWDLAIGAEIARLNHRPWGITSLAVLPDGRLVSGSKDKTVRVWDVATGTEIARLEVDAPVNCLAALSDGRLVAGDELGRLHWLQVID